MNIKSKKINQDFFLYLILIVSIFCISFRVYTLTLIMSLVSITLILLTKRINVRFISVSLFIFSFFIIYIIFGVNNGVLTETVDKFVLKQMLFIFSAYLFFILPLLNNDTLKIIEYYLVFSLAYYYTIILYSFFNGYIGYNNIFDPFINENINSPLIALLGVLSTITTIDIRLEYKRNRIINILLIISICFFSGIYLGSRASLIILTFYIILKFHKMIIKVGLYFIPLIIISIHFFKIDYFQILDVGGFSTRGVSSSRFGMFVYGFNNMWDYPFGGLSVYSNEYSGHWFHNMFLDIVRVAGYTTMLYWILILIVTFFIILCNKKMYNKKTFGICFIIYIIALSQDLAFDGQYNIMCFVFFIIGLNFKIAFTKEGILEG